MFHSVCRSVSHCKNAMRSESVWSRHASCCLRPCSLWIWHNQLSTLNLYILPSFLHLHTVPMGNFYIFLLYPAVLMVSCIHIRSPWRPWESSWYAPRIGLSGLGQAVPAAKVLFFILAALTAGSAVPSGLLMPQMVLWQSWRGFSEEHIQYIHVCWNIIILSRDIGCMSKLHLS